MSRITSKLQVTIPRHVADRFGLAPGDEIEWVAEGGSIRVLFPGSRRELTVEERRALFDEATERIRSIHAGRESSRSGDRGWTREDLYAEPGNH